MAVFTEPEKFSVLPGSAADTGKIQSEGSTLNPSLVNLFPAIYQLALAAGGKAPERTTFNEFLRLILQRLYYIERGGVWSYDATADYPAGAVVGYSGSLYLALGDNGPGTGTGAVTPGKNTAVWQKLVLESGNAATATKLATARTIALSGAATGTATNFDGSGNITIPVTALSGSAITSAITVYDLVPDGAANHRSFYRGKDLTAAFNAGTVSANIANGTFRDIFPGDYITKNVTVAATANAAAATYTIKFIIADLDIWLHRGDTSCETHHVAIVPETPPFSSYMNADNVTTGGYVGSYMNQTVMSAFATGLQNAFGASHLISFSWWEDTTVNTNVPSAGYAGWTGALQGNASWNSYICHLMQEGMVYGQKVWASSGCDEYMCGQFAAFRLNNNLIFDRSWYWLSDVVSSASFANVDGTGVANPGDASTSLGVRPFALLV